MRLTLQSVRKLLTIFSISALGACGGGGGASVPPTMYSVGGYVAGLTGSGLTLSYNGGAAAAVSRNGAFTSTTTAISGSAYSVAVAGQPANPTQTCVVGNGSGSVGSSDINSVTVVCSQPVGTLAYVVSAGSISDQPGLPDTPGSISVYAIAPGSGALSLLSGSMVTTGPQVDSFLFVPGTSFAWALDVGNITSFDSPDNISSIYNYTVDSSTGLLTPVAGSPFTALDGTQQTPAGCSGGDAGLGFTWAATFYAGGMFGYAANYQSMGGNNRGTWVFTVDPATGAPSGLGSNVPGACGSAVTINPNGQFAYAGEYPTNGGTGLMAYTIDTTTGSLTALPGASPSFTISGAVTVDPFGRFVYAPSGNGIYAFSVDPTSGALTEVAGSPFAPSGPTAIAIEPRGQFAYVTGPDGLYTNSIDASTGALTQVGAPLALQGPSGGAPSGMQIDPSGQYIYLTAAAPLNDAGIYAYAIDASTGALTLVAGSPFAVGSYPAYPAVMAIAN